MGLAAFNRMRRLQAEKQETNEVNPHLEGLTVPELKEIAKQEDIENYSNLKKGELLEALKDYEPKQEESEE